MANRYSFFDSKSNFFPKTIFPLNLSMLNSSVSSLKKYVSAGFVSTSLAVTAARTVPTSVSERQKYK